MFPVFFVTVNIKYIDGPAHRYSNSDVFGENELSTL